MKRPAQDWIDYYAHLARRSRADNDTASAVFFTARALKMMRNAPRWDSSEDLKRQP